MEDRPNEKLTTRQVSSNPNHPEQASSSSSVTQSQMIEKDPLSEFYAEFEAFYGYKFPVENCKLAMKAFEKEAMQLDAPKHGNKAPHLVHSTKTHKTLCKPHYIE